ncbi:MAG: LemA family protein [Draconibacterium sp.]
MNSTLIILLVVLVIVAFVFISIYNGLIRRRNEVDNAFGGMDVQLKKRYDLIPNLVASVKEYAKHEKELLNKITELRASALKPGLSVNEKIALDNEISGAIKNMLISVENYPELKANENFIFLQRSLNEVESQISAARRTFNAVVTEYNNGIQVFPNNIFAGMMGMTRKEVFVIPQAERENIDVGKMFKAE